MAIAYRPCTDHNTVLQLIILCFLYNLNNLFGGLYGDSNMCGLHSSIIRSIGPL